MTESIPNVRVGTKNVPTLPDSEESIQNPMDAYTGHLQGGFPSRSTMTGKAMK